MKNKRIPKINWSLGSIYSLYNLKYMEEEEVFAIAKIIQIKKILVYKIIF